MDATVDTLGRLDILVNCAGVQPTSPLTNLSEEDWDSLFATNARGVFLGSGAVVNVASIEGLQPAWGHSHYSASKAGVIMHTRAAALELGAHGLRVNAVSPGLIWSSDLEQAWPDGVRR
jgi:NAD(P)-dependent dehydrogenase (short-subunit alcohol dehydrogenase family)